VTSSTYTRTWLVDTVERVLRTFVATLAAFFLGDVTVLSVDWSNALAVSGTTALVTLLLCVGAKGAGEPGTASFADAVKANTKGTVA
jgi:hypothetical protein